MRKKIWDIIVYFILALGISPLSSAVKGQNIKLPFLVFGCTLLLFSNYELRRLFWRNLPSRNTVTPLFIAVIMFLVGLMTGTNKSVVITDFIAVASFLFFFFIKIDNAKDYLSLHEFSIKLCWALSLLETYYLANGLYTPNFEVGSAAEGRVITLTICPFYLSMHYLRNGKIYLSMLFVSIMVYMCLIGAMRINYFFPICYVLFLLSTFFSNSTISVRKKITLITIFVISTLLVFPIAKAFLEADHVRYVNAVTRFEALFNDDDTFSESTRSGCNQVIIERPWEFLIPEGLGWSNHTRLLQTRFRNEYNILGTVDSNFLYCVYHFGLFVGLWLIYAIAGGLARSLINSRHGQVKPMLDIYNYLIICILALFILKAWVFIYFSFGITYGLLATLCLNRNINNSHVQ